MKRARHAGEVQSRYFSIDNVMPPPTKESRLIIAAREITCTPFTNTGARSRILHSLLVYFWHDLRSMIIYYAFRNTRRRRAKYVRAAITYLMPRRSSAWLFYAHFRWYWCWIWWITKAVWDIFDIDFGDTLILGLLMLMWIYTLSLPHYSWAWYYWWDISFPPKICGAPASTIPRYSQSHFAWLPAAW